jgi:NAD(P)-dependent dehydrogenase (short-subunit alcohol dehydrogenase family)
VAVDGSGVVGDRPLSDIRRVVMITGAAGDIGRAAALRLAADGWSLALTDHPVASEALADTCALVEATGAAVWSASCDVTDDDVVAATVAHCCEAFGAPAALFNNAGYQGHFTALPNYPAADLRKVFEVNVIGVMQVLQHVATAMISAGIAGSIVNTASMAGVGGAPNMPAYSASKAAVIGLTKSAAKDLAPHGIRVNAISPAFIGPGKMWDNQVASQAATKSQYYAHDAATVAEQMIGMVPLRRYGSTAEVASVVSFLMSDDSSYMTGQNLEITGGSA